MIWSRSWMLNLSTFIMLIFGKDPRAACLASTGLLTVFSLGVDMLDGKTGFSLLNNPFNYKKHVLEKPQTRITKFT
jgi:hypothetical protein